MDAQTLRRALADFYKFSPKDFFVQASPTGFMVNLLPKNPVLTQLFRLQVTVTGSEPAEVGVRYGEINQEPADAGMDVSNFPLFKWVVSDGDTTVYVVIPCVWDTDWAFWKRTAVPLSVASAAVLPSATNGFAYCRLANIVVVDGKITTCSPSVSGDQTWSRLPSPTLFADDFTKR